MVIKIRQLPRTEDQRARDGWRRTQDDAGADKANRVPSAPENNLIKFDSLGDLKDSDISSPSSNLIITLVSDVIGVVIKAFSAQLKNLQEWTDSAGNVLARIQGNGRFYTSNGVVSDALDGGGSMILFDKYGVDVIKDVSGSGNFELSGSVFGNEFTDTLRAPFTQDDVDSKHWIIIRSGDYKGAMAIIDEYVDATTVLLHTMGWDFNLSNVDYRIIDHPMAAIGDGNHMEFNVGTRGHFDIHSTDWLSNDFSQFLFEVEMNAGADSVDGGFFKANANGYNMVNSLVVDYDSGDLQPGDRGGAVAARVTVSDAVDSDVTTLIECYLAVIVNGSDAKTTAFKSLPGFTDALEVQGADSEDPGYGYDIDDSLGTVTDRVTGAAPAGTAFLNSSATNVTLFSSNGDYILIGSDNTFEIIEYIASIAGSKSISPQFDYSTGSGTWSTLSILSDGSSGLQQSGQISFTAPVDWAKGDTAETAADITSAYYVRITRTRIATLVIPPVEDHFLIYDSRATGMRIDGNGFVIPRQAVDADAPNNSIYYSTTQSKLVFKDSGGSINDLY